MINKVLAVKPRKKRPYKLIYRYKIVTQKQIGGILSTGIIYPIETSEWETYGFSTEKT